MSAFFSQTSLHFQTAGSSTSFPSNIEDPVIIRANIFSVLSQAFGIIFDCENSTKSNTVQQDIFALHPLRVAGYESRSGAIFGRCRRAVDEPSGHGVNKITERGRRDE